MSQSEQILSHLKQGKGLTQLEATNRFGCLRLAARVSDLKRRGCNIETVMIEKNNKRFAEYRLKGVL